MHFVGGSENNSKIYETAIYIAAHEPVRSGLEKRRIRNIDTIHNLL